MRYYEFLNTYNTTPEEARRRHLLLFVAAFIFCSAIWVFVNIGYYAGLDPGQRAKTIATDLIGSTAEVAILVFLSLVYSKQIVLFFMKEEKTMKRLFWQVVILTVMNTLSTVVMALLYQYIYPDRESIFWKVMFTDGIVVTTISSTFFVSYLISRFRDEQESRLKAEYSAKMKEYDALQSKLDKLAIQSDNHFMFNCFSTLAGMVEDNHDATLFLDRLTGMYRYLVINADKHLVPLQEEISFTRQFAELLKYRYKGVDVTIDVPEDASSPLVSPVSIQPLVENAVKHNRHGSEDSLLISVMRDGDYLKVSNNILPLTDMEESSGKGLENLATRYRTLSGKEIGIHNENGYFTVSIPLLFIEDLEDEDFDNRR